MGKKLKTTKRKPRKKKITMRFQLPFPNFRVGKEDNGWEEQICGIEVECKLGDPVLRNATTKGRKKFGGGIKRKVKENQKRSSP